MSKKILVVENLGTFLCGLWIDSTMNDDPRKMWEERFADHELDVIGFEADAKEVSDELFMKGFRYGDKLQVFVVKPKKPEVKKCL